MNRKIKYFYYLFYSEFNHSVNVVDNENNKAQ